MLSLNTGAWRQRLRREVLPFPAAPAGAARTRDDSREPFELSQRYLNSGKRLLDIVISVAGLTVLGLLLPVLALAIKLDSPGPVFFSQTRIGIDRRRRRPRGCGVGRDRRRVLYPGRPFRIHKLRSMSVDAEARGPRWACQDDERVTRVGAWLRRTRLDEFPQFWNVLKGEMSVIGPRPERLCFIRQLEQHVPHYMERLVVLPGITGLAQVVNGYDTDVESVRRKVALDRLYIRRLCGREDLRVLWLTLRVMIAGRGAR